MKRRLDTHLVCVRHRDGWCATLKKTTRYADHIKTLCKMHVTYPWDIEFKEPNFVDCPECLKRLRLGVKG